jgi:hypothetical protein
MLLQHKLTLSRLFLIIKIDEDDFYSLYAIILSTLIYLINVDNIIAYNE